jgi:hypothetical protein
MAELVQQLESASSETMSLSNRASATIPESSPRTGGYTWFLQIFMRASIVIIW